MIGRRLGQHTPCNYWSKWQVELVENLLQFIHQNALVHNVLERWSVEPEIVVSWWDDPLIFTKTNFENLNCHQMSTSILLFQYGSTWWFDMMVKWRVLPCWHHVLIIVIWVICAIPAIDLEFLEDMVHPNYMYNWHPPHSSLPPEGTAAAGASSSESWTSFGRRWPRTFGVRVFEGLQWDDTYPKTSDFVSNSCSHWGEGLKQHVIANVSSLKLEHALNICWSH